MFETRGTLALVIFNLVLAAIAVTVGLILKQGPGIVFGAPVVLTLSLLFFTIKPTRTLFQKLPGTSETKAMIAGIVGLAIYAAYRHITTSLGW